MISIPSFILRNLVLSLLLLSSLSLAQRTLLMPMEPTGQKLNWIPSVQSITQDSNRTWVPQDSLQLWFSKQADSVLKNPILLRKSILANFKVQELIMVQWNNPESQTIRYKWFPLWGRFQIQQSANLWVYTETAETAKKCSAQKLKLGTWCGFWECPHPDWNIVQIHQALDTLRAHCLFPPPDPKAQK
jgi:hypothetical protein